MIEPENSEPALTPDVVGQSPEASTDGFDFGSMMEIAQNMQQEALLAQQQLASTELVGTAGGGVVSVTLNGHLHLVGIRIQPEAVDPEDPSMLEDLIRVAWQDAHDQVAHLQSQVDPMAGFSGLGDLGGLGDMLGGV